MKGHSAAVASSRTCKRRPPALSIDDISAQYHSVTAWPPRNQDIPVFRTFIDFGHLRRMAGTPPDSPPSTAPARLGASMRGAFASFDSSSTVSSTSWNVPTPPGSSEASTRVSASSLLQGFQLPESLVISRPGSPTLRDLRSPSFEDAPQADVWMGGSGPRQTTTEFDIPCFSKQVKLVGHIGRNGVDDGESTDDGQTSDDDQILCPEYSENAPLPSAGSAAHGEGKCKRCCFFPKGRCSNGYECLFCHFAHEKRIKFKGKKKKTRKRKQHQHAMRALASGSPTSHAHSTHASCLQPVSEGSFSYARAMPAHMPSRLVVADLHFVPSTVTVNDLFAPSPVAQSHQPTMQRWQRF